MQSFDRNGDHWLNAAERQAARAFLNQGGARRSRGPGMPPGGGPAGTHPTALAGPRLSPADVKAYPDAPLYAPDVLRTLFLDFEEADWEKELEDFHGTDVDVAAKLTVDGTLYPDVGVRFRGASSYGMVSTGYKRSLNLTLDLAHNDQNLQGYSTLNLLNSHEDPSFLRPVLFLHIARQYLAAPQANLVRVVINGEYWGVYVNVQQFNKEFVNQWFGSPRGARWKVPGSPQGRGSLAYLGEDVDAYRAIYEIKSKDTPASWADLIGLCRVLNQTPAAELQTALAPRLDIDGALRFLALGNVMINNDGYWVRASDYSLYEDEKGQFHVIPIDVNETFSPAGGPGGPPRAGPGFGGPGRGREAGGVFPGGGPGGGSGARSGGVSLDPLVAASAADRPLIAKLLAVPALRARYLGYVREIAEKWLDWGTLGPIATPYHALIADAVKTDTRKLASLAAFEASLDGVTSPSGEPRLGRPVISLKGFAEQRRAYLLGHAEVRQAARQTEGAP